MKELGKTGGASACLPRRDGDTTSPRNADDVSDIDLTGVDPLRRAEVRRRVAVVRSYLATSEPDDVARPRHAKALGLSDNQFMALVRSWRAQPSASSVPGSGRSRGTSRATGPRHLDPRVKKAAEAAVAALNPNVNLGEAVDAVAAACAAIGLTGPKKATVHKMLTEKRQHRVSPQEAGILVVGRARVRLPTIAGDVLVLPMLTLAVRADDGVVIAATINSVDAISSGVVALASQVADLRHLQVDYDLVSQLPTSTRYIGTLLPGVEIRRQLCRILGNGIGGVRLVYKTGGEARPERFLRASMDQPLSPSDAASVVLDAINASNAARNGPPAAWLD